MNPEAERLAIRIYDELHKYESSKNPVIRLKANGLKEARLEGWDRWYKKNMNAFINLLESYKKDKWLPRDKRGKTTLLTFRAMFYHTDETTVTMETTEGEDAFIHSEAIETDFDFIKAASEWVQGLEAREYPNPENPDEIIALVKNRYEKIKADLCKLLFNLPDSIQAPVTIHPDYIQEMIKQGRLFPDGKRAMKSLDDVLDYLTEVFDTIPARFVQETFQKPDGKPYSMKHIQGILEKYNYGKTPEKPRKTSRQSK